jgi:hypothetical protein
MNDVKFIREEQSSSLGGQILKRFYSANSREEALAYLRRTPVEKMLYYIIIDTPQGRFGKDVEGTYDPSGNEIEIEALKRNPEYFRNIFNIGYLENQGPAVFHTDLSEIPEIKKTPHLVAESYRIYMSGLGSVLAAIRRAGDTGQIDSKCLYEADGFVCLNVTAFPCRSENVEECIVRGSKNAERSYLDLLRVVLGQRPRKRLTHWTHLLVCLGDGSLHLALGRYRNWMRREQIFVFPAAVVNAQEAKDLSQTATGLPARVR